MAILHFRGNGENGFVEYSNKPNEIIRIDHFPDGQVNLILPELNRKEDIDLVEYRFTCSDDIFIFMQLVDILQRQEIHVNELIIPYLLCARQDRVISLEQPYSLKIIANIINSLKANLVQIVEPHSEKSLREINHSISYSEGLKKILLDNCTYCFPDKGAAERYSDDYLEQFDNINIMYASKHRDPKTNYLSNFTLEEVPETIHSTIIVLDDLCDGGGTFCGLAPILREKAPKANLVLIVTHAIQKAGIEKVAKLYNRVIISDSYKGWQKENLPSNVKVFDYWTGTCLNKSIS